MSDDKPRKPTMNDIATTPIFGQVTVSGQGSYMINLPEEIRKRDDAIRVMKNALWFYGAVDGMSVNDDDRSAGYPGRRARQALTAADKILGAKDE